ncbi:GNAT family N-acetyltransferase [Lentiprolixibacter aurantiacus]|uniref:GNAT family N-acetyltransferase n=1 Tax=Lentiprolixibacter aurantiacus TaxID=2993939 RepID=A0AAE3SPC0_9FLAO|nr:GNAT family N-acetyltransferase [Lentiprolixibacter aurantiacus]MCX2719357.1 GNAT family N-acetyltransferase [Lentiprolixibacter aurantiacus]
MKLQGKHIYLRAIEPGDLDFLYELENNPELWEISGTAAPYSRHVLKQYLDNAHRDIFEVKQLRLCICDLNHKLLGLIDIFDFDPKNSRAGVGLVVSDPASRNHGYGREALELVIDYAFYTLNMRQLYAHIGEQNAQSIHLFTKLGFEKAGLLEDWTRYGKDFRNVLLFQKLNR